MCSFSSAKKKKGPNSQSSAGDVGDKHLLRDINQTVVMCTDLNQPRYDQRTSRKITCFLKAVQLLCYRKEQPDKSSQ